VDLVETQMLEWSCVTRTKTCLVLMNKELSILCTKCHFERLFISHRFKRWFICLCTKYM